MTTDVTVDDFLAGVVAACKTLGYSTISLRDASFYESIAATYETLVASAPALDLDVRFAVFVDPVHGDSPVVGQALTTAVQRKLVSLDNPEYVNMRIKLNADAAERLLDTLPGGRNLYTQLARVFLDAESAISTA